MSGNKAKTTPSHPDAPKAKLDRSWKKQTTPYISKPEFLVKEVRGCRPFPVARVPPHLPVSGRGASRAKGISPKSIFKHHNSRASQEERPKAHPQPSNLTFPSLS